MVDSISPESKFTCSVDKINISSTAAIIDCTMYDVVKIWLLTNLVCQVEMVGGILVGTSSWVGEISKSCKASVCKFINVNSCCQFIDRNCCENGGNTFVRCIKTSTFMDLMEPLRRSFNEKGDGGVNENSCSSKFSWGGYGILRVQVMLDMLGCGIIDPSNII